jgi:hypothetical protein
MGFAEEGILAVVTDRKGDIAVYCQGVKNGS